jgi:hypothetical protein
MVFLSRRARYLVAAALLATSACAGNRSVPVAGMDASNASFMRTPEAAVDTTSILKALTKNVTIGSTIDASNGDRAPHGLAIVPFAYGPLKKGGLVVCNANNKANGSGLGTTIEQLAATAGSKPVRLGQNAALLGCGSLSLDGGDSTYTAATGAKSITQYAYNGKTYALYSTTKGSSVTAPFGIEWGQQVGNSYNPRIVFATDATNGTILSIQVANPAPYPVTVIATGFAVNKKAGAATLAPSGLAYNAKTDTLYIVDGANDTIVAFAKATTILLKNAIQVQPGGKTFKYAKGQKTGAATVVYSGAALKSPVASTLLPNGNLVVAGTKGGNTLIELTPTGTILDTDKVNTTAKAGIFALAASGTSDANTVLYYTDANLNTVQNLTR